MVIAHLADRFLRNPRTVELIELWLKEKKKSPREFWTGGTMSLVSDLTPEERQTPFHVARTCVCNTLEGLLHAATRKATADKYELLDTIVRFLKVFPPHMIEESRHEWGNTNSQLIVEARETLMAVIAQYGKDDNGEDQS